MRQIIFFHSLLDKAKELLITTMTLTFPSFNKLPSLYVSCNILLRKIYYSFNLALIFPHFNFSLLFSFYDTLCSLNRYFVANDLIYKSCT